MTDKVHRAGHGARDGGGRDPEAGERPHLLDRLLADILPPLAIERDQADGVGVVLMTEAHPEPARLEPVDEARQQHGARPVDLLEGGQVEVDLTGRDQVALNLLDGAHHRGRVREVEGASRKQTGALAIGFRPDGYVHQRRTIPSGRTVAARSSLGTGTGIPTMSAPAAPAKR
jgi:hypothetical protein